MKIPAVYETCQELELSLTEDADKVFKSLKTKEIVAKRFVDSLDTVLRSRESITEYSKQHLTLDQLEMLSESQMILDNCEYVIRCTLKGLRPFASIHIDNLLNGCEVLQTIDNHYCTYLHVEEETNRTFVACYSSEKDALNYGDVRKQIYFNHRTRMIETDSFKLDLNN